MLYQIPKNPGILFSKIPGSGFDFNPGIPGYPGIPLGPDPQLVAARIIWFFWTQPLKGVREKKHLERNLMENEIFTEAVPSTLIMTFLIVVIGSYEERKLIIGEQSSADKVLFFVTFATSVLSAGLGLAKCLKV